MASKDKQAPIPKKNRYVITGITTGRRPDGSWPPRRDIDDLMNDPDRKQFILFLVAFHKIQQRGLDNILSYYQLAGIHGYPRSLWPTTGGPPSGFYCEHKKYTFTTWHRVYMVLFEQAMHEIIMDLASNPEYTDIVFPESERPAWVRAAETWRLPYWDPCYRRSYNNNCASLPECAMNEFDVSAQTPPPWVPGLPGVRWPIPIENPLYSYRYPLPEGGSLKCHFMEDVYQPSTGDMVVPSTKQRRSVRYAPNYKEEDQSIQKYWIDGISDINKLKKQFQVVTETIREDLISFMTESEEFKLFVKGLENAPPGKQIPNLDSLHGFIHDTVGGDLSSWYAKKGDKDKESPTNGNMAWVAVAAFDPIFFLWHAAVDRWIAMWQAGHPDPSDPKLWVPENENSLPLYPFVAPGGSLDKPTWWVSSKCRDINQLGYTYEVVDEIKKKGLKRVVLEHYADVRIPENPTELKHDLQSRDGKPMMADYVVTARYETNEIGPFRLLIFIHIDSHEYEVGRIVNFVAHPTAACANCDENKKDGLVVTSSTHISPALRRLKADGRLDKDVDIEKYMKQNLSWKVFGMQGELISKPEEEFPSLKVDIKRRERAIVTPPRDFHPKPQPYLPDLPRLGRGRFRGGFPEPPSQSAPWSEVVHTEPLSGIF